MAIFTSVCQNSNATTLNLKKIRACAIGPNIGEELRHPLIPFPTPLVKAAVSSVGKHYFYASSSSIEKEDSVHTHGGSSGLRIHVYA